MSQSYGHKEREEQLRIDDMQVDAIQFDEQGNIIFNEFEQRERNSAYWQHFEKKYGINFGDVVNLSGNHLGRVKELSVSQGYKDSNGLLREEVYIKLGGGKKFNIACSEAGDSAKEFLKDIKIQPREKKLSITEKIKNTIKTKVQTFKKGGAAERLANKRALQNTQGLER